MAYSAEFRNRILSMVDKGYTVDEIAADNGLSKPTVYSWLKKYNKDNTPNASIHNLKQQIDRLSKLTPTKANTTKINMLTKSIERLSKGSKATIKPNAKAPKKITDTATIKELKVKVLDHEYGLYPYQQKFLEDNSRFRVWLKSRQIGATYLGALEALIGACGGMEQTVISASEDQAMRWYDEIGVHAKKLGVVLSGTQTKIVVDNTPINIRPNNFRTVQGFSGDLWFDEFAWYQNPKRIFNLAMPTITSKKVEGRAAKVTILSTPFEEESLFYNLISDTGRYYMFSRHITNIYDAIKDGLDVDIKVLRDLMDSDSFAMAYECVFADDDNAYFPVKLIKSCVDYNLSYHTPPNDQVLYCGYDIGRVKDLSVLSGVYRDNTPPRLRASTSGNLKNSNVFKGNDQEGNYYIVAIMDTLKNASFKDQKNHLKAHLNSYLKAHINIDKTGIGMNLTEDLQNEHNDRVNGVYFTASSKEMMVKNVRKLFEDKLIKIPNDPALIADIHAIKRRAGSKSFLYDSDRNSYGHADRFWSLALACKNLDGFRGGERESRGGAMLF